MAAPRIDAPGALAPTPDAFRPRPAVRPPQTTIDRWFWTAVLLLLAAAGASRVWQADADAPGGVENDHALSIDGSWYTAAALDAALGRVGEVPRSYDRPAYSAWAKLCYLVLGPTWRTTQLISVLPSLGIVVLVALLARTLYGAAAGLVAAALAACDCSHFVFSRSAVIYTFAEVCAAAVLVCAARSERGAKLGWLALAWGLWLFSMAAVKEIFVLLLPALVLSSRLPAWWRRRRSFAVVGLALAAAALVSAALAFNLHERFGQKFADYLAGAGPLEIAKRFLSWEERSGVLRAAPLAAVLALGACLCRRLRPQELPLGAVLVCGLLAFTPTSYSPFRYHLVLFPALFVLAAGALVRIAGAQPAAPGAAPESSALSSRPSFAVAVLRFAAAAIAAYFTYELWLALLPNQLLPRVAAWSVTVAALALAAKARTAMKLPVGLRPIAAAVLILAATVPQILRTAATCAEPSFSVVHALREVGAMLPEQAVLSGPFAHLLTTENRMRRELISSVRFGRGALERSYRSQQVTHLCFDLNDHGAEIVRAFEADGARLEPVHRFSIRGAAVQVFRLPWAEDLCGLSPFEAGVAALERGEVEVAEKHLKAALRSRPDSSAVRAAIADVRLRAGKAQEALRLAEEVLSRSPYEIRAHGVAAAALLEAGRLREAAAHLESLARLDPTNRDARGLAARIRREQGF